MSPLFIVADLDRSVEFYTEKLGFEIDFRYEYFYVGISKDGCSIHLKSGWPDTEASRNKRNNEHIDITFSVANIKDLYDGLQNNLVEFVQPLRQMPYGQEFYIADPDGHIIAFLE